MVSIFLLKFVHVLGASVLFGTGLGIAYFMFMAHRTGHAGVIAVTARFAVLADLIRAARNVPASAGSLLASLADMPVTTVAPLGPKNPYPAAS